MTIEQNFYAVKTAICCTGYLASVALGEPSGVLAAVSALSAAALAVLLWVQGEEE